MSRTIEISDETYSRLEAMARFRDKQNVAQLLDEWDDAEFAAWQQELARRRQLGGEMRELRDKIEREHGIMPDSTDLLREDRER